MSGPRGTWSPDISPVSALGIHAITEVDRMRYATIAATQDWERLMSERAWYLTYGVAKERYFNERLKELEASQKALSDTAASDHLVLFTEDRKSTRLNSSHVAISYAVFCLKKKRKTNKDER